MERRLARRSIDASLVTFVPAAGLVPGDVIVVTEDGYRWYERERVLANERHLRESCWVSAEGSPGYAGSGSSTHAADALVAIRRRSC